MAGRRVSASFFLATHREIIYTILEVASSHGRVSTIVTLNQKLIDMALEQDQEFVEMVVRAIVNNPDDVRTERTVDERGVLITLHINQEDMGYVIGRQGQTARSLRTLLKIVGAKNNARVNLKIYEPEGSRRPPRREYSDSNDNNNEEEVDTSAVEELSI